MTTDSPSHRPGITAYRDAPARYIAAGDVTFA